MDFEQDQYEFCMSDLNDVDTYAHFVQTISDRIIDQESLKFFIWARWAETHICSEEEYDRVLDHPIGKTMPIVPMYEEGMRFKAWQEANQNCN